MKREQPRQPQWRGEQQAVPTRLFGEVVELLVEKAPEANRWPFKKVGELVGPSVHERPLGAA